MVIFFGEQVLMNNRILAKRSFYGILKFKKFKKIQKNLKDNLNGFDSHLNLFLKRSCLLNKNLKKLQNLNQKLFEIWIKIYQQKKKLIERFEKGNYILHVDKTYKKSLNFLILLVQCSTFMIDFFDFFNFI